MREFVYFSRKARTSGNIKDLMKAGRLDIACHIVIHSFFVSHAIRKNVKLHLFFYGPPDPPKHIELYNKQDELKQINILPPGGGYKLGFDDRASIRVEFLGKDRYFIVHENGRKILLTTPKDVLPVGYRGEEVLGEIKHYDLGEVVCKLEPLITVKI